MTFDQYAKNVCACMIGIVKNKFDKLRCFSTKAKLTKVSDAKLKGLMCDHLHDVSQLPKEHGIKYTL